MIFNKILNFTQNSLKYLYENSLFLQCIDKFILLSILAVFLTSTFLSSDVIGFVALTTMFLTFLKLITKPGQKLTYKSFEIWLLAYFMVIIISLFGSTLFALSLKGFFKTVIYLGFYLSVAQYLKDNFNKTPLILATIGICAGFEGIVGFLQNFAQVEEISTWQDVSALNPEQVMTRVYGTLKPLNPNLLGGYLVAGIPSLFGMSAYFFSKNKFKSSILWVVFAFLTSITLFLTGCRGAYIGFMAIVAGIFLVSAKYLWNDYKKIYLTVVGGIISLMTFVILFSTSLRARVLSMFAMREDSSNSFRFNVYQSSFEMFKDNWLLGIGIGNQNFREIYGLYMRTGYDALSAYNVFLEIAVESGIFALIAFVGFLYVLIRNSVRFIINSCNIEKVIFISTAAIAITAIMVHGIVDTIFFRPQIQFIFWTMAAIISAGINNLKDVHN